MLTGLYKLTLHSVAVKLSRRNRNFIGRMPPVSNVAVQSTGPSVCHILILLYCIRPADSTYNLIEIETCSHSKHAFAVRSTSPLRSRSDLNAHGAALTLRSTARKHIVTARHPCWWNLPSTPVTKPGRRISTLSAVRRLCRPSSRYLFIGSLTSIHSGSLFK